MTTTSEMFQNVMDSFPKSLSAYTIYIRGSSEINYLDVLKFSWFLMFEKLSNIDWGVEKSV